jgi:penicillin-binding protein 1B
VAFVAGYLPPEHTSCQQSSSWLDWFHLGGDGEQPPEPGEPVAPDEAPPVEETEQ